MADNAQFERVTQLMKQYYNVISPKNRVEKLRALSSAASSRIGFTEVASRNGSLKSGQKRG